MSKTRRPRKSAVPAAGRPASARPAASPGASAPVVLSPRTRFVLLAVLTAIVTGLVFSSVLHADFVLWDDGLHVFQNPFLNPPTPGGVWHLWTHAYEFLYVPLAYTAYAGLAALARLPQPQDVPGLGEITLDAGVFHAANLLLHCANAVLVFVLLRRLVRQDGAALAGALLFALHPVQTESVAWISEMRGLLSAFFALWALLLFQRRQALASVFLVLALLCKPSAACVPLIAWAIAHWAEGISMRECARRLWPWLVLSFAFGLLTSQLQASSQVIAIPLWQRPFVMGDALAFYLGKLVWPVDLVTDYGRNPFWVMEHRQTLWRWLIPAGVALLVWVAGRRAPILRAAGAVFAAALLPVLGLTPFVFQVYSTVADRYLYLAMLGPAMAAAWLLSRLPAGRPALLGGTACAVALLLLAGQSTVQAQYWNDTSALMRHTIAVNPRAWGAYTNLGAFYVNLNQLPQAQASFEASLRFNPRNATARTDHASVLQQEGRVLEAVQELQTAIRMRPDYARAHIGLGVCFDKLKQTDAAIAEYRAGLRLDPYSAEAHNFLGVDLAAQGKNAQALREFQEAVRLAPDATGFRLNLTQALQTAGQAKKDSH